MSAEIVDAAVEAIAAEAAEGIALTFGIPATGRLVLGEIVKRVAFGALVAAGVRQPDYVEVAMGAGSSVTVIDGPPP